MLANTLVAMALLAGPAETDQLLPNGIHLSGPWPPKIGELSREPLAVPPYLVSPPAVIGIDVGRQLLVDAFLIQSTTLRRTHHLPEYHPANPLVQPDKPWEGVGGRGRAGVFSDGVWYDPADRQFKITRA